MGVMRVLDETGDSVISWSPEDASATRAARRAFDAQRCKGHLAFARPDGAPADSAEFTREFDPGAEEIIWVRPVRGG